MFCSEYRHFRWHHCERPRLRESLVPVCHSGRSNLLAAKTVLEKKQHNILFNFWHHRTGCDSGSVSPISCLSYCHFLWLKLLGYPLTYTSQYALHGLPLFLLSWGRHILADIGYPFLHTHYPCHVSLVSLTFASEWFDMMCCVWNINFLWYVDVTCIIPISNAANLEID